MCLFIHHWRRFRFFLWCCLKFWWTEWVSKIVFCHNSVHQVSGIDEAKCDTQNEVFLPFFYSKGVEWMMGSGRNSTLKLISREMVFQWTHAYMRTFKLFHTIEWWQCYPLFSWLATCQPKDVPTLIFCPLYVI